MWFGRVKVLLHRTRDALHAETLVWGYNGLLLHSAKCKRCDAHNSGALADTVVNVQRVNKCEC